MNINNIKFVSLSYLLIILAFYSTVVTSTYAFNDDFGTLENAIAHIDAPYIFDIASGRPLFALFRVFDGLITGGIEDLWVQRAISVASLILLALFINRFVTNRNVFNRDEYKFAFPLMIVLLPSFQVFSSWATCYPFTLAVLLSGMSYSSLTSDFFKGTLAKWSCSFALISSSFAIYQPAGMAFMAFVLFDQCLSPGLFKYKRLLISFVMMCLGMISSFIMIKIIPLVFLGGTLSRSKMTSDPLGKLYWFFNEALPNALASYSIESSKPMLVIGIVFFITGLVYVSKSTHGAKKTVFALCFIVASYFPNLYVSESWAAQRSMVALSMCVVGVSLFGLMKLSENALSRFEFSFPAILSVILISCAGVKAAGNINNYMVINQISEMESVAAEIASKVDKSFTGKVMVDISNRNWGAFSKVVRYDEFGENSIYAPWASRGVLLSIAKNKGYSFSVPRNPVVSDQNQCLDNCITIKANKGMMNSSLNY